MPTYSYACNQCGHTFDIVQSFSDDSLTVCPTCEGPLRKVYNAVGVVFKGSGFYRTDSRSSGKSSTSSSSGSSSTGSSSGGSSAASGAGSSDSGSGSSSSGAGASTGSSPAATPSSAGKGSTSSS